MLLVPVSIVPGHYSMLSSMMQWYGTWLSNLLLLASLDNLGTGLQGSTGDCVTSL